MEQPFLFRAAARTRRVWQSQGAYLLDLAVAPFVRPHETIVLSGFWRSGTTWLEEVFTERIGAKSVFEPFRFRVDGMPGHYRRLDLPGGESFRRAFMPCTREAESRRLVSRIVGRGLRSTLRSEQVRMYRNTDWIRRSLRRRVVLKTVRAHLALDWIRRAFPNPIVHVFRDPRAVIASAIYKTDRMWGVFEPFDLAGQLLDVEDGRAGYFSTWEKEIRRLNGQPFGIQLAAYWALTERYLLDNLADAARPVEFVQYEALVEDPETRIPDLLARIPVQTAGGSAHAGFEADSASTTRTGQAAADRLHGWRDLLSGSEAGTIAAIARDFGLEARLVD